MCGRKSATGETGARVLYDGWPLVFDPGGPAALHLMAILDELPAEMDAWLALPAGVSFPLPTHVQAVIEAPAARFGGQRMVWEQATLPGLIRKHRADVLHMTTARAPLASPVPSLVSPAEGLPGGRPAGGLGERLRDAFGRGGMRSALTLWPEDLAAPEPSAPWAALPVLVHRAFLTKQPYRTDLPAAYVLAPGPLPDAAIPLLAAAWSWAAAGVDEACALMTADLSPRALEDLRARCQAAGIANPVAAAEISGMADRAALYQQSAAVVLVGPVQPWGDAFAQALASGCPLAAEETRASDARVGPAGYLVPQGDARALGAALLTLLVEEPVAEQLSEAARQRAAGWGSESYMARLGEWYKKAASGTA